MHWRIEDPELINLYTNGNSKKYRVNKELATKFALRVQQIDAAKDINDLFNLQSLNFRKATNRKSGKFYTVSLDDNVYFLVEYCKTSEPNSILILEIILT